VDFFGWKNASMCQEYISSSKPAILGMANRLSGIAENYKVEQAQEVFLSQDNDDVFANIEVETYETASHTQNFSNEASVAR
jgi:hypothetical protein